MTSSEALITVLDTNIVLDLWVLNDPRAEGLRSALTQSRLRWIATAAMREELRRVLSYAHLLARLQADSRIPDDVLHEFDHRAELLEDAPKASCTCKDPDDQKFIDLSVAHRALLFSKDAQVLCMRRRLERQGVTLNPHMPAPPGFAVAPERKEFFAQLFIP